jgi:hypothetical protein
MVGLLLWHVAGLRGRRRVTLTLSRAAREGIPRRTAQRALRALQAAGLVLIRHKPGKGLLVTLLDPPG